MQVLVMFFSQKLTELQAHLGCTLDALVANAAAGEPSVTCPPGSEAAAETTTMVVSPTAVPWPGPDACTEHVEEGKTPQPQPWAQGDVPDSWQQPLLDITGLLGQLQQRAVGVAAVAEVVRRDVSTSVGALGEEWRSTRILEPAECYMQRVPLQLQRLVLSSLVCFHISLLATTLAISKTELCTVPPNWWSVVQDVNIYPA
jgi:hypothetical protein